MSFYSVSNVPRHSPDPFSGVMLTPGGKTADHNSLKTFFFLQANVQACVTNIFKVADHKKYLICLLEEILGFPLLNQ